MTVDRIDKLILKVMLENGCGEGRWLSTHDIANTAQINWKTAKAHLKKLRTLHYVKNQTKGKVRIFNRSNNTVRSERKIEWTLNVRSH